MKAKLFQNKISVRPSKVHNYGVFADKNIRKGEVIEECYAIVDEENSSLLTNYTYCADDRRVFVTGYGMIYNHSNSPNAEYTYNKSNQAVSYKANRFIRKGEEIYISYTKEWFDKRNMVIKEPQVRIGLINAVTLSLTRMALVSGAVYGGFLLMMHYYQPWVKLMLSLKI
jgi:uncharacterized protein